MDPMSYIEPSSLWKSKPYPIGTGLKIAYLFPAQSIKKCQSIAYIGFCGRAADGSGRPWQALFRGPPVDGVSPVGTAFVPASVITKQNTNTIGKNKDFIELFSMF